MIGAAGRSPVASSLGEREPVHLRHLAVEQHQRKGSPPRAASPPPRARPPPSTSVGPCPIASSISGGSARFVALSSTTRTGVRAAPGRRARLRVLGRAGGQPDREMERAALARLALDPDPCRPSCVTSRAEIARPRPVPPYWRVVELSAWVNASKITACFSAGMPMPVSLHRECSTTSSSACRRLRSHARRPPRRCSVNLIGVADQVDEDLAQPAGVADQRVGHVAATSTGQLQALLLRPQRRAFAVSRGVAQVEVDRVEVELARLDLGEVEDVVDHRQERVGRRVHHLEIFALLGRQRRCRAPAPSCR